MDVMCIVMCVSVCVCVCVSHSRYVSQGASSEAFGQQTLEVCCSLNCEQKQLHLNLLSSCSHDFGKLHP